MRVFFLCQEAYRNYLEEPGYYEVMAAFRAAGVMSAERSFVYQRRFRELKRTRGFLPNEWLARGLTTLPGRVGRRPVVVFGATAHTERILGYLRQLDVVALTDSNSTMWGTRRWGFDVVSPREALLRASDIVVSTHDYQEQIVGVLEDDLGYRGRIHRLYELEPLVSLVHEPLEAEARAAVAEFHPDLIVLIPTYPGENLRAEFFHSLRSDFPSTKLYTQWWDHHETVRSFVEFERQCLRFSDMVGMHDSWTGFQQIRRREGKFASFEHVDRLHWHPTVHDPAHYRRLGLPKRYDVAIFGSAENERRKWIELLERELPGSFHHFGSLQEVDRYLSVADYVRILNETKVFVNCQTFGYRIQYKGKVREALACGTFLLEEDNPETRAVVPNDGLAYFDSPMSLLDRVRYYLEHEAEREAIAERGHRWYGEHHNAGAWVNVILENVGLASRSRRRRGNGGTHLL